MMSFKIPNFANSNSTWLADKAIGVTVSQLFGLVTLINLSISLLLSWNPCLTVSGSWIFSNRLLVLIRLLDGQMVLCDITDRQIGLYCFHPPLGSQCFIPYVYPETYYQHICHNCKNFMKMVWNVNKQSKHAQLF